MSSSYLSDLEHKRIEARVHRDRVTETYFISDTSKGIRRKAEKKTWWVRDVIGRGSFGQVRREVCEDGQNTSMERAVKQITLDLASARSKRNMSDLKAKQYQNELKALLEFSKPKYKEMSVFVEFLGWFEDGLDLFIAMEYIPLGDLEKNLPANGKLPEQEVKVIAKQILDGLNIMHLESLAHRDLKPQNVLVVQGSPDWWIKLADFGLTKRLTESTQYKTHAGTLAYMAPEMFNKGEGSPDYTHAVDIWALGCIVFRLLTNSVPFPSPFELFKYSDDPSTFPSQKLFDCEASFKSADLMMKLLKARPPERPTSSQALKHQWLSSNTASLGSSGSSCVSVDSERSIVLEDTSQPAISSEAKDAAIHSVPRSTKQDLSTGGYDTATNPVLKSHVAVGTAINYSPPSRGQNSSDPKQLHSQLSRPSSPGPGPTPKLEEDHSGPRSVDIQSLNILESSVSRLSLSHESSLALEESPIPLGLRHEHEESDSMTSRTRNGLIDRLASSDHENDEETQHYPPLPYICKPATRIPNDAIHTQTPLEQLKILPSPRHLIDPREMAPVDLWNGLHGPATNERTAAIGDTSSHSARAISESKGRGRVKNDSVPDPYAKVKGARSDNGLKQIPSRNSVTAKILFNLRKKASKTSSKPIPVVRGEIIRVLKELGVDFEHRGGSRFICSWWHNRSGEESRHSPITFDVYVVGNEARHEVKFSRIGGDTFHYDQIVDQIVTELRI